MKARQALVVMLLLLSGCGGCQPSEETPGGGGAAGGAAKPDAANAPAAAQGKIQVAPLQPTLAGAARSGAAVEAAPPAAGAATEAAAPEPNDEGDCIVVGDANPDYGPPPLAVAFSVEAECSAGQPTYKWDFGDGSSPSSEANPSHTYTKPGDYTATITVSGPGGANASDEIDITVEEGEAEPQ